MRSRFPARRTEPSSAHAAPSNAPIARTSCGFPFNANTDVREATRRPSTLASAVISSSVMPSLRYSLSGSPLALANGSTAMPRPHAATDTPPPRDAGACNAATNSAAVARRSAGSLARARARARSMWTGASGRDARKGAGDSVTCFAIVARAPSPRIGGPPASIS